VVLAVTEAQGISAIINRLRATLHEGARLRFGASLYPDDGTEPGMLFERATSRLD
jgi:hypothetical protein